MKRKRVISMFLAAVLFLSTGEFTVLAESVSENAFIETEEIGEMEETEEIGESDETKETDEAEEQKVHSVSEDSIWTGRDNPGNPNHHCVDYDITKWSYIYFGSYPQSEVTDGALISAIESEIKVSGIKKQDGIDVWLNGTKYRRCCADDYYRGGNFQNATYRYFKWERIKWRVLHNDGAGILVMADKALEGKSYHSDVKDEWVTWEISDLRSFLNGRFYNNSFSDMEKNAIVTQNLVNEDYVDEEKISEGGNNTSDKVFLLAWEDTVNQAYGFPIDSDASESRRVEPSEYAYRIGVDMDESYEPPYKEGCTWWLRSKGECSYAYQDAGYVSASGYSSKSGSTVSYVEGVVPVVYLPLSSKAWSFQDDGTSGDGGENRVLTGLEAVKTKTAYVAGETLNVDDLKVIAGYQIHGKKELAKGDYTTNAASVDMKTPGSKKLTISYSEGGITKTASVQITVKSIEINAPSKKLAAGKKVSLTCTDTDGKKINDKVTWKSSNKKYATVNQKGKLTLKKAGAGKSVTITATTKDGRHIKATCKIRIMKHAVKSISLKAPAKTLKTGKSMTVKATIKTTGKKVNKTLKWTSSNNEYASVNNKGKVTAKKAGAGKTVTITAASTDGTGKKAKVKIRIK